MRLLKNIFICFISALVFASCEDKGSEPDTGNNTGFTVNITDSGYETVAIHKSYYNPEYESSGSQSDYYYGLKVLLKLDDPSKRSSINNLVIRFGNSGFSFNKQALEEAYVDSVEGYVFEYLSLEDIRYYSQIKWEATLYDNSGDSSNPYYFITSLGSLFSPQDCVNEWSAKNVLNISLTQLEDGILEDTKAETHFLNAAYEEIECNTSSINGAKWKAENVPSSAVYFYYILSDEYLGVKRRFISKIYGIQERYADNVEVIGAIDNPRKIEYLEDLDKVLVLPYYIGNKLTLLNYDDNSVVWEKQLDESPESFWYSPERKTIYLSYYSGRIDSINPADGTGKELFNSYGRPIEICAFDDFLYVFFPHVTTYKVYNFRTKEISEFDGLNYYISQGYQFIHDSLSKRIFMEVNGNTLISFKYNAITGALTPVNSVGTPNNYVINGFAFNQANGMFYLGEGYIYNSSFTEEGRLDPFTHLTFISDSYVAAINDIYRDAHYVEYPPAISLYNSSNMLLGRKIGFAGKPKRIYHKGNNIKVFSVQKGNPAEDNVKLMVENYTVEELLNSPYGKLNIKKKLYRAARL